MVKFTIELPDRVMLRNVNGEAVYWDVGETPAEVMAHIAVAGGRVILTNAYNGGGKDATEAERLAAMQKKMDAWKKGEFNVVERGESAFTGMREAFIDHFREATGATTKQAEAYIRDSVVARFGKDAKATFSAFLDAMAAERVKDGEFENAADAREALEAFYAKLADEAAKKRAKAADKLVAPKIDLSAFKKSAK